MNTPAHSERPRVEVTDHPALNRFEARIHGEFAGYLDYNLIGDMMMFVHTIVQEAFKGQGVGGALARHALDVARSNGKGVVPVCSFIADHIRKHRDEYLDLVRPDIRQTFEI